MAILFKTSLPELEPKKDNRFEIILPEKFGIPSYMVQSAEKPKIRNGNWENIKIGFLDVIEPSSPQLLMNMLKSNEIFSFIFHHLDPIGVPVEEWEIKVRKIVGVDFGNVDYGCDKINIVTMELGIIECKLNY